MPKLSSHGNHGKDVRPIATINGLEELHSLKSIVEAEPTAATMLAIQRLYQEVSRRIVISLGSEWLRANMIPRHEDWKPDGRSSRTGKKIVPGNRAPWPAMIGDAELEAFREKLKTMFGANVTRRTPARDPQLELFQTSYNAVIRHKATATAHVELGPAAIDHHVVFDRARQPIFCPCHAEFVPCVLIESTIDGQIWPEAVCSQDASHRFPPLYDKEAWKGVLLNRPMCTGCDSRETLPIGPYEGPIKAELHVCANCDHVTVLTAPRVLSHAVKNSGPDGIRKWVQRKIEESGLPDPQERLERRGLVFTRQTLEFNGIMDARKLELLRVRYLMQLIGREKLQNWRGRQAPVYRLYLRARAYQDIRQGFVHGGPVYAAWARDYLGLKGKQSWIEGSDVVTWARRKFKHLEPTPKRVSYANEIAWLWDQFRADAAKGPLPTTTHYNKVLRAQFPKWTNTHLENVVVVERKKFLVENPGVVTITQLNDRARRAAEADVAEQ